MLALFIVQESHASEVGFPVMPTGEWNYTTSCNQDVLKECLRANVMEPHWNNFQAYCDAMDTTTTQYSRFKNLNCASAPWSLDPDYWCNEWATKIINVTRCMEYNRCCNDWPSMPYDTFRWIQSANQYLTHVPSVWNMLFGASLKYMAPNELNCDARGERPPPAFPQHTSFYKCSQLTKALVLRSALQKAL